VVSNQIWDSSSSTDGKEGSAAGQVIAVRVISLAAALFWGVLFFGITDLLVVPDQDERFYEHYLLETGWGLLYTMLVMAPLVFWVVRPSWQVFPQQVTAVALAVLLCGLVTPAAGQAFVAFLLAITVIVPSVLARRPLWPIRGLSVRGANPWLSTLVLTAAAAAVVYALQMIEAAHAGRPDDNTWGLMHLPMQAALGLALAGSATIYRYWLVRPAHLAGSCPCCHRLCPLFGSARFPWPTRRTWAA